MTRSPRPVTEPALACSGALRDRQDPQDPGLRPGDIATPSGAATLRARRLRGQEVAVTGYVSPRPEARRYELTARSTAPCQICGALHDPGPAVAFEAPALSLGSLDPGQVTPHAAVTVTGRLLIENARPRLEAAHLARPRQRAPVARGSTPRRDAGPRSTARPGRGVRVDEAGRGPGASTTGPADTILRGGRIHTLCEALGTVEAVAVRQGRFVAVGSEEEVAVHAGPDTEVVDLGGACAVPGLIDSHLHQIMLAVNLPAVDLLGAADIAEVQARIAARAGVTPPGAWVVASSGWHESILDEGRMPTRWELDAAAPQNPVIVPRGGHVVTANSAALALAGIDDDTPDPAGGVIVRDAGSGQATGVLLETAANLVRRVAPPPPPPEKLADQLAEAMSLLNSYGIVCVVDPSVDERISEVYKRLHREGRMTVRTDLLYKIRDIDETRRAIGYVTAQDGDAMLRFPGLKIMLDGGVEGARMHEPYRIVPGEQPHADYRGLLLMPPGGEPELMDCLEAAAEAGLQVQIHGVGDECIDVIAGCFETMASTHDIAALHWCLMHVFLPAEPALERLRRAGVRLTVQDHPVLLGHNQRRWWGDERAAAAIPIRRLIDAGLPVGGGSDGPVVPVDPFLSMGWMVTRRTLKGDVLGPDQGITAREALALYTLENARILGVADDRGSIEAGKRADLAVLSQDLLAVDPEAIRDTRALLTMLDGRIVYRAPFADPSP